MKKFAVGLIFLPAEEDDFFGYLPDWVGPARFWLQDEKIVEYNYSGGWVRV